MAKHRAHSRREGVIMLILVLAAVLVLCCTGCVASFMLRMR